MASDYDDPPTQPPGGEQTSGSGRQAEQPATGSGATWFVGPPEEPNRFEVTGPPMTGSEGVTWRSRYTGRLDNPVALAVKQLNRPPGADLDWPSPAERGRWQDHRILLQSLPAAHLVSVVDVFLGAPPHAAGAERPPGVIPYVVMPWIEGPSLARHAGGSRATARSLPERLALVRDLADALGSLHAVARGQTNVLVHRDIKPGNCIVTPAHGLVLVDLGTLRLTADGFDDLGMHTPEYAAPEVLADPRAPRGRASDVYSLGAVAYFALVGNDPPTAGDPARTRTEVRSVAAAARLPDPEAFARHLTTAMARDPADRPADPVAWAAELARLAAPATVDRVDRTLSWTAAVVAVALLCVAALLWGRSMGSTSEATPVPANTFATVVPNRFGVRILEPRATQRVPHCAAFRGRSALPAGRTMVLAMRNITNGETVRYLQPVFDWDHPTRLATWRGVQFFGTGDASVGQDYMVEVLVADVRTVAASKHAALAAGEIWTMVALPAGWEVAAAVTVHRISGRGPC